MNMHIDFPFTPDYCRYYLDLVETGDLISELEKTKQHTLELFDRIRPENENFSYQSGKWTTKEVLRHIVDCERIYSYRAFRFSRFDETELAGFDEGMYIANLNSSLLNLSGLKEDYLSVRSSTISLFKGMTDEMLDFKGTANQGVFSARALGYMCVGHNIHHCNMLKERYL